jgi:hypothetical protein
MRRACLTIAASLWVVACSGGGETGGSPGGGQHQGGGGAGEQPAAGGGGAGGRQEGGSSAGGGGSCETDPPAAGRPIDDPDAPCATLTLDGEPEARVVFLDRGSDATFEEAVEILYAFRFAYRVPAGDPGAYTLEQYRCEEPAGEPETCFTIPLTAPSKACEGPVFGPKFAVDPSQYNPGENRYTFEMRLLRGCDVVSHDRFEMTLTYDP